MINILTQRHTYEKVEDYQHYTIKCPCCETIMNFGKVDVCKGEDDFLIHHEYLYCPECGEKIQLSDDFYFGY